MRVLRKEQVDQLESLIDSSTVNAVLNALAEVCRAKAEHIDANWQDYGTAQYWSKVANRIEDCAGKVAI